MFSGIIEGMATVVAIEKEQENVNFTLRCPFGKELKPAQSLAHNGVCLTIVTVEGDTYTTTAMRETLERSNLGDLKVGDEVNVERAMAVGDRLDGHIVQGHVDETAVCTAREEAGGSFIYTFEYPLNHEMARHGYFTVDKGSVTVNGVSLTVCNPTDNSFQVNIIPFTFEHTNFHAIQPGTRVNLEFDILGKILSRLNHFQYASARAIGPLVRRISAFRKFRSHHPTTGRDERNFRSLFSVLNPLYRSRKRKAYRHRTACRT